MRLKIITILLMFSLSFNILHDLVLAKESSDSCPIVIQIIEETTPNQICSDSISSFHYFFHIFAIFNNITISFIKKSKQDIKHNISLVSLNIKNPLLRPPIG